MAERHRVVIIGAGFGGLAAVRALAGADVDITIVDQRNHHTFQPLLYQVATAGLDADDICYSTRGLTSRQPNARSMQALVTRIDLERRIVETNDDPIPYDHLVVAIGAVTNDFGVQGVAKHAFGLKNVAEATDLRTHVLRSFEGAERNPDDQSLSTIVVVGGGPTGVEMAGGFAELFHRVLRHDFPGVEQARHRIVLVEGQSTLLASFRPRLSAMARKRLEHMGVEVLLDKTVERVTHNSVELGDGTVIPAATTVWAAGVRPHPLAAALDLESERGRITVTDQLRLPDHPEVFVVGDVAATKLAGGTLAPQVAAVAMQGGRHVALAIRAEVERSAPPAAFEYRDKGSMATIGRNSAVVELPRGLAFGGFLGWVAWLLLHLVMLIGYRNRANVLVNWAWNYVTYDRGSRVIVEPDPAPTGSAIRSS
ncbi:MAG: NAD(P)/FAD-dependent oxidoreductase [Acidimicrobiales bacterium]